MYRDDAASPPPASANISPAEPTPAATPSAALAPDAIRAYLAALGLGDIDPAYERIVCWTSLQAFVSTRIEANPRALPNNNTRLRIYGLEKSRVMSMLIRHVVS